METLVTILHVLVCIFLMLTVLLQAGKGGGMGAAFGGGSSMGTVFGGSGAGNFLRRLTIAAAVIFMVTSMTLAWMATPSTDPLKKMWADSYEENNQKKRAHEAATGTPAPVEGEGVEGAAPAAGAEDESAVETPDEAPAADGTTPPAATPTDVPAATPADKPAATPADKPAATPADKPAAATPPPADKPAATPAVPTPAQPGATP